jgi:hypothetical protein
VTRRPTTTTTVLTGPAAAVAAGAASRLFASATVVVLANPRDKAGLAVAAATARRAHAPLLLTSASITAGEAMAWTEIRALAAREVLDTSMPAGRLAAELPGVGVITDPARLPVTRAPRPLRHVVVLVRRQDKSPGTQAATATALAAGAKVITVNSNDPRTDPAAITALSAARPTQVLAVGGGFGSARLLTSRVAVAATGVQLPGGGQVLFPMHRLLALYGFPGTPSLGALGQQDLTESIARIRGIAAAYRPLSGAPVVPAFEIIATVAQSSPGPARTYSYESTVGSLLPWVRRANASGMYVVLDLQPGRANLLAQAKRYEQLLKLPDVGLALDPEWKLRPGQLPLQQIGNVDITEVNSVIRWLAWLTARYHLPQKLLVLHQFRLSMITDEQRLDTGHDDIAIVIHMDGQGTPAVKLNTWNAVVGSAPPGVFFGWKNFYDKDHPTLSPLQTMANTPQPVMISYQLPADGRARAGARSSHRGDRPIGRALSSQLRVRVSRRPLAIPQPAAGKLSRASSVRLSLDPPIRLVAGGRGNERRVLWPGTMGVVRLP